MSTSSRPEPVAPYSMTPAAFLIAPGIASFAGGLGVSFVGLCAPRIGWELILVGPFLFSLFFAVVGYPTAAILGVPLYLMLPERARSAFAIVVPLAGAIAAAPWVLIAAPWQTGRIDLTLAEIAFALGCVGGIAFLFVRRPRATVGEAAWDRREPLDAV